ncbi:unnamed protein product [Orchesella dallaii]|uniref:Peptidase M14 domain-containing protein n=1 Tax=Orchesella dallaii TaxID=48710 RepID=A0ABP1Q8Q4_9HEXA
MNSKLIVSLCTTSSLFILLSVTNNGVLGGGMNKPRKLYSGYKLIRVSNISSEYEDVLIQTLEQRDTVQLWRIPKINHTVEMLVGQSRLEDVLEFLRDIEVQADIIHQDISQVLNEERDNYQSASGVPLTFAKYHDYDDIIDYFMSKTGHNSAVANLTAEIIGKSEQGRDIYLFRASKETSEDYYPVAPHQREKLKPAIWIDAGLHGRDWLAISTSAYILNKIISGDFEYILAEYDVYVIPLINPDGYHYTRTTDRFWAKNLGIRANGRGCAGVNLDRNFAYMYRGELMEIYSKGSGVAHNPCSDFYGGSYAHIEPEVTAISRALWARRKSITLYLSLQSYSQIWLLPREQLDNSHFQKLTRLADVGNSALEDKTGTKYVISSWEDSYAEPPGKCVDWVNQIAGVKYSFGLKLRDDGSSRGYLVPATEIESVGEEVLAAVSAIALSNSADSIE